MVEVSSELAAAIDREIERRSEKSVFEEPLVALRPDSHMATPFIQT